MASELTYQDLEQVVNSGTVEFIGNQVKLNFTQLANVADPNNSCIAGIQALLRGLVALTEQARAQGNPELEFASSEFLGTPAAPILEYRVRFQVNPSSLTNSLLDPTEATA